VPEALARCQLTHIERTPIDLARARAQHAAYEQALTTLGCQVRRIAAADDLPDSVFVEDAAVVVDEIAVITRPGAASRLEERDGVAASLSAFREALWLEAPATLDGGDVLHLGRTLYVGMGGRSNDEGVSQLRNAVDRFGYDVRSVRAHGCLHLKSAATALGPDFVLVNPEWIAPATFEGARVIEIDPAEPYAANVLRAGETVLCAEAFPRTRARIEAAGIQTRTVDVSELAKAEGALTCCSIIFKRRTGELANRRTSEPVNWRTGEPAK
jgi:dimethylargininase